MKSIAIIGSAGRGKDAERLDVSLYDAMYRESLATVREHGIEEAVSGGAAFADHIAVRLFLSGDVASLRLYLPAVFDGRAFVPNARVHSNPGKTANSHHADFKRSCGVDGLSEIREAISKGARIEVYSGFKRRNLEVAGNCTHMEAYTFGSRTTKVFLPGHPGFSSAEEAGLKDGGTAFHGSDVSVENRRNHTSIFLPDDPGFRDAKLAGLKDGGTAHCWNECWRAEMKMHCNLFDLAETLK